MKYQSNTIKARTAKQQKLIYLFYYMFTVYYMFILLLWVDLIETAITASTTTLTPKRATYDYKEFNEFIIWNRQINCKTTETPEKDRIMGKSKLNSY